MLEQAMLPVSVGHARPVREGTFKVNQNHLGFCPSDVILQIMPDEIRLCNDEDRVAGYPYTNLCMWHASGRKLTLLLISTLKRIVLETRSRRDARKIALRLYQVAGELEKSRQRRAKAKMANSVDKGGISGSSLDVVNEAGASGEEITLEDFQVFKVKQLHLPDEDEIAMLRVGVSLKANQP